MAAFKFFAARDSSESPVLQLQTRKKKFNTNWVSRHSKVTLLLCVTAGHAASSFKLDAVPLAVTVSYQWVYRGAPNSVFTGLLIIMMVMQSGFTGKLSYFKFKLFRVDALQLEGHVRSESVARRLILQQSHPHWHVST